MTATARALCAELLPVEGDLWFSTDPRERARAKAICAACPLRAGCANAALDNLREYGVWGGLDTRDRDRLHGRPTTGPHPDDLDSGTPIRHANRRVCGTEPAFRAHRLAGVRDCAVCEEAHTARIDAQRRAQLAREHAAGGSTTGYELHRRLDETACPRCHAAMLRDRAERKRAQRAAAREAAEQDGQAAA